MDLATLVAEADSIPPTPQLLPKLQTILRNPATDIDDLITVLRVDATLTARIVRMSNSVYYGSADRSENLEEAIGRIGFNEVYRLVALAASQDAFGGPAPVYGMEAGELMQGAVAVAATMVELVSATRSGNPDTAYTLGLMHALGKVVLNGYYAKRGLVIYEGSGLTVTPAMERQFLGFDHAQVGSAVLRKWNFPETEAETIEKYVEPPVGDDSPVAQQAWTLRLAVLCLEAVYEGKIFSETSQVKEAREAIGLDADSLPELVQRARDAFLSLETLFG